MATHLKSLAKRARLNEGHVKAARIYKARVTALVSERDELRNQVQNMTEEAVKHKSNLKHTMSARAQAESREEKARGSLRVAEVEHREVKVGCRRPRRTCWRPGTSSRLPKLSFRLSGMSCNCETP